MEARYVIRAALFVCLFIIQRVVFSQEKYLLFIDSKDSLLTIGDTRFYKIDGENFDILRYSMIDTISYQEYKKLSIDNVQQLRELCDVKRKNYLNSLPNDEVIDVSLAGLETNNDLLSHIYVLEKLTIFCYLRTRVWWIDY